MRSVLIAIGKPTFGNVRGAAPTPAKALLTALERAGYTLIVVDEWCTSQRCDVCGAELKRTRGASVRHWRCPNDAGSTHAQHDLRRHRAEQVGARVSRCTCVCVCVCVCALSWLTRAWRVASHQNKDVSAARSMVLIMLSLLLLGRRPAHLQRDDAAAARNDDNNNDDDSNDNIDNNDDDNDNHNHNNKNGDDAEEREAKRRKPGTCARCRCSAASVHV